MVILGIETSCDETAVSVVEIKRGKFNIISNVVSSQIKIHQKYGGVVPELAARKHTENIIPVVKKALNIWKWKSDFQTENRISISKKQIQPKYPDAIAVVCGPGLATSLMVGVETAKALAWVWKIPLIPINHLEAHIYANWLKEGCGVIKFPSICLLVSGGHTELILMKKFCKYKIIGETVDDAAGEAFDKVAKLLNLSYPGGPNIAKLAQKSSLLTSVETKNSPLTMGVIKFPRPLINSKDFNFSFSGLKTAVRQRVADYNNLELGVSVNDICASFQQSVIDVLIVKTIRAAKQYKVKTIMLAGGVAANQELRKQMAEKIKNELPTSNLILPEQQFCTDNAAMVAAAGYFHYNKNLQPYNLKKINIDPNLKL